jgi:nitrile hydratase accessory protein
LTPLEAIPSIPRDRGEPVFREPWEARAFALAVSLHERGVFTWPEWAHALGAQIAAAPADDDSHYYGHWLSALERLLANKGFTA